MTTRRAPPRRPVVLLFYILPTYHCMPVSESVKHAGQVRKPLLAVLGTVLLMLVLLPREQQMMRAILQQQQSEPIQQERSRSPEPEYDGEKERDLGSSSLPRSSIQESAGDDIRSWGCGLVTTPVIFIHIGKAGGGSVRARFAAAALDYNRTNWKVQEDESYYAIPSSNASRPAEEERAYFCNSGWSNARYAWHKSFEGTVTCPAVTPLGLAVACPGTMDTMKRCRACRFFPPAQSDTTGCHHVYVGHNFLGAELRFLPPQFLQQWWQDGLSQQQQQQQQTGATVSVAPDNYLSGHAQHQQSLLQSVDRLSLSSTTWCASSAEQHRPTTRQAYEKVYDSCVIPLAQKVDSLAQSWRQGIPTEPTLPNTTTTTPTTTTTIFPTAYNLTMDTSINWGPVYASLPVLRTTVTREPFSWLLSRFFWSRHHVHYRCRDVTAAAFRPRDPRWRGVSVTRTSSLGWAHRTAVEYIVYLCGEDCSARLAQAKAALGRGYTVAHDNALLESFVRQADYNLRHSFAVVGLNEDMDGFYDMVTSRVDYLDMALNPHVVGDRHSAGSSAECQALYQSAAFQQELTEASPAVAALVQLHQTAARVNAFQREELATCATA